MILYNSLKKHSTAFHLYIFAFDDITFETLNSLNLDCVTAIALSDFETVELRNVKKNRSKAEYCWTCTPSTISYVLKQFDVPDCTYIDADLCFFSDPSVLIREMLDNGKNVLISEHRYSFFPKLYEQERAGRFCVQFMTFTNEKSSLDVLEIWRKQCIEWCYAKHENGKFGDQKYLDEWPVKYHNVHILQHPGGGLAPWNISNYRILLDKDRLSLRDKKKKEKFVAVFYHYQFVKSLGNGYFDIGWYPMGTVVKNSFYLSYLAELENIEGLLLRKKNNYKRVYAEMGSYISRNPAKFLIKKIMKFNIMKINTDGISGQS